MHAGDFFGTIKIGDGAGDAQHAVIAARGEPHGFRSIGKQPRPGGIRACDRVEQFAFRFSVCPQLETVIAAALDVTRFSDTRGDGFASL